MKQMDEDLMSEQVIDLRKIFPMSYRWPFYASNEIIFNFCFYISLLFYAG